MRHHMKLQGHHITSQKGRVADIITANHTPAQTTTRDIPDTSLHWAWQRDTAHVATVTHATLCYAASIRELAPLLC